MTCGEWALTLAAVLVVFVMTSMFVLASVGIAPVIDANGLSFDATGYITHEANRTARYIADQNAKTEQNRQDNETLRWFAIVGGVAGTVALVVYQRERTKRHKATLKAQENETRMRLKMYIAYLGIQGTVGRYKGDLGVFDHANGEFVPASVALLELGNKDY